MKPRDASREMQHRFGKRTILVADSSPWVGKCTEAFVARLFSLSYGFSCPDVQWGDPLDDLIHRFGHRAVRGLLVALGRPDGRLFSMTKGEAAVLLSARQLRFVENKGTCPEIISLGHNPFYETENVESHVVLPSFTRPKFIDEFIYTQLWMQKAMAPAAPPPERASSPKNIGRSLTLDTSRSLSSNDLMGYFLNRTPKKKSTEMHDFSAQRKYAANGGSAGVLGLMDNSLHGGLHGVGMDSSYAGGSFGQLVQATKPSESLQYLKDVTTALQKGNETDRREADRRVSDAGMIKTVKVVEAVAKLKRGVKKRRAGEVVRPDQLSILPDHLNYHSQRVITPRHRDSCNPSETMAFKGNLDPATQRAVDKFAEAQRMMESRFASLERFVAFTVMFNACAETVNQDLWMLPDWDTSRSQSHMRTNSTACPVDDTSTPSDLYTSTFVSHVSNTELTITSLIENSKKPAPVESVEVDSDNEIYDDEWKSEYCITKQLGTDGLRWTEEATQMAKGHRVKWYCIQLDADVMSVTRENGEVVYLNPFGTPCEREESSYLECLKTFTRGMSDASSVGTIGYNYEDKSSEAGSESEAYDDTCDDNMNLDEISAETV